MTSKRSPALILILALALGLLFSGAAIAQEDQYAAVRDKIEECTACHGTNGASENPDFPILAGQHFYYTYVQLKDFKAARRANEIMEEIAKGLEKSEMKLIAQFFSEQVWPNIAYRPEAAVAAAGRTAADSGQCVACHLGDYTGNSRVPRISGQHPKYLAKTMLDFKHKQRMNSPSIATLLAAFSDEDIEAMAEFLAGF
ncbi:MAG: c-type cytochrome [Alphaproteobacteria bacterium]